MPSRRMLQLATLVLSASVLALAAATVRSAYGVPVASHLSVQVRNVGATAFGPLSPQVVALFFAAGLACVAALGLRRRRGARG